MSLAIVDAPSVTRSLLPEPFRSYRKGPVSIETIMAMREALGATLTGEANIAMMRTSTYHMNLVLHDRTTYLEAFRRKGYFIFSVSGSPVDANRRLAPNTKSDVEYSMEEATMILDYIEATRNVVFDTP